MVDNVNIINLNFDRSNLPNGFTGLAIYPNRLKEWYVNGQRHREDGPAREWPNGTKQWFAYDKLNRIDGPASEDSQSGKFWYINGHLHRQDGPAVELLDGTKEWYINGKLHREDGPASIDADGTIEWYLNGSPIFHLFPTLGYIIISEGMPCDIEWMGRPVKAYKVLTTRGIEFIPDLPGMRDILFGRQ
jgi:hypothetical protein